MRLQLKVSRQGRSSGKYRVVCNTMAVFNSTLFCPLIRVESLVVFSGTSTLTVRVGQKLCKNYPSVFILHFSREEWSLTSPDEAT